MLFFKELETKESKYWQIIDNPRELSKGDLIVYTSEEPGENHCMLVHSIINEQKESITLKVIDSSQYPHKNDSRSKQEKGIGIGEITIFKTNQKWNSFRYNVHIYSGIINMARSR